MTQDKSSFVLCLVCAVLLAAIVITGYVQLAHDPMIVDRFNPHPRGELTDLIKAFVK